MLPDVVRDRFWLNPWGALRCYPFAAKLGLSFDQHVRALRDWLTEDYSLTVERLRTRGRSFRWEDGGPPEVSPWIDPMLEARAAAWRIREAPPPTLAEIGAWLGITRLP